MSTLKKTVIMMLIVSHSLAYTAKKNESIADNKIEAMKNGIVAKNMAATSKAVATKNTTAMNTAPTSKAVGAKNMTPTNASAKPDFKQEVSSTKKVIDKKQAKAQQKKSHADNLIDRSICCENSWTIGGSALYFRPSFGGNGLGYSSFSNYGTDFFGNVIEVDGAINYLSNVQPKRDLGFQAEVSYLFGKANDININWHHLRDGTEGRLPQGTLFAGSASALYAGILNIGSSWDAINIELGQYVYFGDLQALRLHFGMEYADIKNTFTNYPQLTALGNPVFITRDKLRYAGIGPRAGVDFGYDMGKSFTLYGKIAGCLLVGRAKQTVTGYHDLGGFNLYSTGNYEQTNKSIVVPELEGKLGLKYDFQCYRHKVIFDIGYQWTTYFNVLVSQVGAGVVSSAISNSAAANFDLNGAYCGLTYVTS